MQNADLYSLIKKRGETLRREIMASVNPDHILLGIALRQNEGARILNEAFPGKDYEKDDRNRRQAWCERMQSPFPEFS